MEIVLGVVVVVVSLYFIAAPFLNEDSVQASLATDKESLDAKESYLKTLEDLEADLRMHKISEEDYATATEEVKKEAGKLLE